MCHLLRSVSVMVCGMVKWEKHPEVAIHSKRVVRLLLLHYFVVIEYFQRTGMNQTTTKRLMDKLRHDVASLAGDKEFLILYPGEKKGTKASESSHHYTRPTIILLWVCLSLRKILDHQALEPPIMNGLLTQMTAINECFWNMDMIDKTQFPFPYAQVVKWLLMVFLSMIPFALAPHCGWLTLAFSAVLTIGFFGLDEVAEILESPFGNDPNDLDIRAYGDPLMSDLELIAHCRDIESDFVFSSDEHLDFSSLIKDFDGGFDHHFRTNLKRSTQLTRSLGAVLVLCRIQGHKPPWPRRGSPWRHKSTKHHRGSLYCQGARPKADAADAMILQLATTKSRSSNW